MFLQLCRKERRKSCIFISDNNVWKWWKTVEVIHLHAHNYYVAHFSSRVKANGHYEYFDKIRGLLLKLAYKKVVYRIKGWRSFGPGYPPGFVHLCEWKLFVTCKLGSWNRCWVNSIYSVPCGEWWPFGVFKTFVLGLACGLLLLT